MRTDELFYFVYGVSIDAPQKEKKQACVEKAYLDMCRTIQYLYSVDYVNKHKTDATVLKFKENKETFIKKAEETIINAIDSYPVFEGEEMDDFDTWHEKVSCRIIEIGACMGIFENKSTLTFGQAQKWINMTLKYMRIMGDEVVNHKIKETEMHIPIDDYIITAAKKSGQIVDSIDVKGLEIDEMEYLHMSSWSKISNYTWYLNYQKEIRKRLKDTGIKPVEWESKAWIAESIYRATQ